MHKSSTASSDNIAEKPVGPVGEEIDLIDLGVSLLQRWKLILAVFAIFMALGVATLALKRTPSSIYTYTTTIQLGANAADGKIGRLLFAEEAAKSLLENGLIDLAISQYERKHESFDARKIKITVMAPKRSGVIFLVGKGPKKLQNAYEEIERIAAKLLNESTYSQSNAARRRLIESKYKRVQLRLKKLENPKTRKGRKIALQQTLLTKQTKLLNLKQRQKNLKQELKGLEQSRILDEKMKKELEQYLARVRANSLQAMNAKTPTEAMTAMLLGSQNQKSLQQLMAINRNLTVDLPKKEERIKGAIANISQNLLIQEKAIEKAKIDLDNFQFNEQSAIDSQKIVMQELKDRMDHLPSTQLIGDPMRTQKLGSRHTARTLLLFAILGIFTGLVTVVLTNYFSEVRRRLAARKQAA